MAAYGAVNFPASNLGPSTNYPDRCFFILISFKQMLGQ